MLEVEKILPGYKPLLYGPFGLLLSKGTSLFLSDLDLNNVQFIAEVEANWKKKLANRFRMSQRLLRADIGPAILLECGNKAVIVVFGRFFLLDISAKTLTEEFVQIQGKRPLSMALVDIDGFERGVIFGEYFGNRPKIPVSILMRSEEGTWKSVYTFGEGEINHIHAIVPDPENQCLYILTGDWEDAAAIWIARDNFNEVKRVVSKGQQSRACWLIRDQENLVYATDTQVEINHINVARIDNSHNLVGFKSLFPVNGSSIHSMQSEKFGVVFSTSVEPAPNPRNFLFGLLDRKSGPGIVGESVCIYSGSLETGFTLVLSAKKDMLPARSFQFGAFLFPSGTPGDSDVIHAYGEAVEKYDGCTVLLKKTTA